MIAAQTPTVFNLTAELPAGTQVIQASAGTGKTYAIASLATRFVAERNIPLSELMLVTFGRAATQELRDRARETIPHAVRRRWPTRPRPAPGTTSVIAHLATGSDADIAQRRVRLLRALSDFDAATIVTTHSFCQRMLDGVGVAGDYQPDAAFRENVADLLGEVSDDLYVDQLQRGGEPAGQRARRAGHRHRGRQRPASPTWFPPTPPAGIRGRPAGGVRAGRPAPN